MKTNLNKFEQNVTLTVRMNKAGAVTIPSVIRDELGLGCSDLFDMEIDRETGQIVLNRINGRCMVTGDTENLIKVNDRYISYVVFEEIREKLKGESLIEELIPDNYVNDESLSDIGKENKYKLKQIKEDILNNIDDKREQKRVKEEFITSLSVVENELKEQLRAKRKLEKLDKIKAEISSNGVTNLSDEDRELLKNQNPITFESMTKFTQENFFNGELEVHEIADKVSNEGKKQIVRRTVTKVYRTEKEPTKAEPKKKKSK